LQSSRRSKEEITTGHGHRGNKRSWSNLCYGLARSACFELFYASGSRISELVALNVIRGVRSAGVGTLLFTGSDLSAPDMCCGNCGAPIIRAMRRTYFNFVFQCTVCEAFNDITLLQA
jgi:hypothetical protein